MKINSLLSSFFLLSLCLISQATDVKQVTVTDITNLQNLVSSLNNTVNYLYSIASLPQLTYTSSGINYYNYMYRDSIIYQSIHEAYNLGVFEKYGAPVGWNVDGYAVTLWNGRSIINIGTGVNSNSAGGIKVHVPSGYNALWVRVLNDRWTTFRVAATDPRDTVTVARYGCGKRGIGEISPDGGEPDSYSLLHIWCPFPLYFPGDYLVFSDINSDDWISGIGFSKNLWNHAKNSAVAYTWKLNGFDSTAPTWNSDNWYNDALTMLPAGQVTIMYVPVIYSGKNKIIYMVEHNNNWVGLMHGSVSVNNQAVERFRTSYSNPFARHINGKIYNRYTATYFPASAFAPGDKFVKLAIDLTLSDANIYMREVGTHDYI